VPAVTGDYYPTLVDLLDLELPDQPRPLDGVSLLPVTEGNMKKRNNSIGFILRNQQAWMTDQFKIYSSDGGENFELYDMANDSAEQKDLSELIDAMKGEIEAWLQSL